MNKIKKNRPERNRRDDFFMKKTIIFIFAILLFYVVVGHVSAEKLIPDDAIRLRVLANSNSEYDQAVKGKVRDLVQKEMYNLLKDTKGSKEAREKIILELPSIETKVKQLLVTEKYPLTYQVHFGQNYFPEKQYKGVTYHAGMYESLLITLGSGEGDNWWCVLFPPLCLIEAEESTEVEYKSFVAEMIDKFM